MICFPLDSTEYKADALGAWCCTRTRGVFSVDANLAVTADGTDMNVTVSPGLGWLKQSEYWGICVLQDTELKLELQTADGTLSRIDTVCVRLDKNMNRGEIVIKKGSYTPQPPAVAPPVRNLDYDEIYIATVMVRAGSTSIRQVDITDQRLNETYCGIMRDGVTGIPTAQLQNQVQQIIDQLHETIDGIEQGSEVMLKTVYDPDGDGVIDIATHAISADTATDQTARDAADTAQTAAAKAQAKADAAMPKTGGTFTGSIAAPQVGVTRLHLTNLDNYGLKCDTATGYNLSWAIAGTKIVDKSGTLKQIAASNISGASSIRYKHDVADLAQETARKLLETRPVQFVYNAEMGDPGIKYGLIAEDLEKTDKAACYYNAQGQVEGINYTMLVAPLIKLCQLQQNELGALTARVEKLEGLEKGEKEKTK